MTETNLMKLIQLTLAEHGVTAFRNNIGRCVSPSGRVINYGVCNPGGSDLIGITPIKITSDMVGCTVGVFTGIEVKTPTGRPTKPQINFINQIDALGGIAGIARSAEDALQLTSRLGRPPEK